MSILIPPAASGDGGVNRLVEEETGSSVVNRNETGSCWRGKGWGSGGQSGRWKIFASLVGLKQPGVAEPQGDSVGAGTAAASSARGRPFRQAKCGLGGSLS